jgi:N4-gp56 family major capsid protein
MKFRQFVRPVDAFGKNKGDRKLFDRISNVVNQGTTINENTKMPETKVTISQGSVIVNEYGNSIPYTGKLEALADFSVDNIWLVALKNDMAKALNTACSAPFKACQIKYTPTGTAGSPTSTYATGGTVAVPATRNVQTWDVKEIVDYLRNVLFAPAYMGDDYMCVANRAFLRAIQDDTEWKDASKYGDPNRLFVGEVGRYYGCRFIEDNHALARVLGTTSYKGEAVFFGLDPVVEAIAIGEEIRAKIPTDYGRDKGLAWYFLGGFAEVWPTAVAGEAKVIHVTST